MTLCYSLTQVTNASVETEFYSSSTVVSFTSGQTTANAVLLLINDEVPEGNETFIVEITGANPRIEVDFLSLFLACRYQTGS